MKRFFAALIVLAAAVPARAGEAGCSGIAPVVPGCRVTFTASGGAVGSESQLIMEGRVDAVATAPSGGRIEVHCVSSVLGSESCTHSLAGPFRAGETVTLTVTVNGTGYWRIGASA